MKPSKCPPRAQCRYRMSSVRRLKTITFQVPATEPKKRSKRVVLDPNQTWPIMESIITQSRGNDGLVVTVEERKALHALNAPAYGKLPFPEPIISPSPYQYFCSVNSDDSHISQPRLSVTKLLTAGWCELRSFYEVFAGLKIIKNQRLSSGTAHHERLEKEAHPALDSELVEMELNKASLNYTKKEKEFLFGTKMAYKLASQWSEKVVTRLVDLASTKMLREIQVHGYLRLINGELADSVDHIADSVLVNGVVDVIALDRYNHTEEKPKYDIESNPTPKASSVEARVKHGILDLSVEIPQAKKVSTILSKDHFLHVVDLKTRAVNSIPTQLSVLSSARDQCMIYSEFLHNISRDSRFGYESSLENARRRNVNPDTPISVGFATELLINQFSTLVLDYLRLAKGESIGFDDYDSYETPASTSEYSLKDFVTEKEFKIMLTELYGSITPILEVNLSPLFCTWKKPLTLRYFAARAGQAFNILEPFRQGSLSVEYHKVNTKKMLGKIHYAFDQSILTKTLKDSASFWNGTRQPESTTSITRCRNCKFRNRCPVLNGGLEKKIGDSIHMLHD